MHLGSWTSDLASRSLALASFVGTTNMSVADAVALARSGKRAAAAAQQSALAKSEDKLRRFQETEGVAAISAPSP